MGCVNHALAAHLECDVTPAHEEAVDSVAATSNDGVVELRVGGSQGREEGDPVPSEGIIWSEGFVGTAVVVEISTLNFRYKIKEREILTGSHNV